MKRNLFLTVVESETSKTEGLAPDEDLFSIYSMIKGAKTRESTCKREGRCFYNQHTPTVTHNHNNDSNPLMRA
jgi:hypothetical protein